MKNRELGAILGRIIADKRKANNMTQEQLAEEAKISISTVKNVESGYVTSAKMETIVSIASALDMDTYELIRFAEYYDGETGGIDEEYIKETETEMERINKEYYAPYSPRISSLCVVMYVIPLIDELELWDIFCRMGGDFWGKEDYVAMLWHKAYNKVPESKAKSFVDRVIEAYRSRAWTLYPPRDAGQSIRDALEQEPEFLSEYEAYCDMVQRRKEEHEMIYAGVTNYLQENYEFRMKQEERRKIKENLRCKITKTQKPKNMQ